MKVALIYVFPNLKLNVYEPLARRFAQSYMQNPPGNYDHTIHVVSNLVPITEKQSKIFSPLPVQFHSHNNYGKDIGAYMMTASRLKCDLIVCAGAPVHFHRGGWLDRIVDTYLNLGPGLYGCWGFRNPADHIRTTFFWMPPDLLLTYPSKVDDASRYSFEHGRTTSILQWTKKNNLPIAMVTWNRIGLYPAFFHVDPNESLVHDQHIDRTMPKPKPVTADMARPQPQPQLR